MRDVQQIALTEQQIAGRLRQFDHKGDSCIYCIASQRLEELRTALDRAIELLRELRRWDVPDWESGSLPEDIDAFLAEVDK